MQVSFSPLCVPGQNTQQCFPLHLKTLGETPLKMQMPSGFVVQIYQVDMKIILTSFLKTLISNVNNNLKAILKCLKYFFSFLLPASLFRNL